uniref:ADP-ribosylation factor-related protein 1 n=1 Tax=Romanomermis culicivorax TaxID=13658 RepID=A0A915ISI3_ROMCU
MYSLLSGLWHHLFRKDEYFVVILGLDNAGKTTFLEQTKTKFNANYKMLNPKKITSTVGLNIGKIDIGAVRLNFWDLGGQEELQSLWDKYYAECHGVIFVVDSTDKERLKESHQAFDKMLNSDVLKGVPLILICNKQDLQSTLQHRGVKSNFSRSNVQESITWMIQCVKRNSLSRPPTNAL